MNDPDFDRYSLDYEQLLKDPTRDRFTGGESGFFQRRKRDLIRSYFRRVKRDTHAMGYLDVGCGKGELISLLRDDFGSVAGCDPSEGMLRSVRGVDARVQTEPLMIPFEAESFDFVTAVCVYHHVSPESRLALTAEVVRVLRPHGVFAVVEHNPLNPITRRIVSRTVIDAGVTLLKSSETRNLMRLAGFVLQPSRYFLFVPGPFYRLAGQALEELLRAVPLGGQYAVFGTKEGSCQA